MKTTREVDIKALVSHVVKGDGINKCRICMGDTSEGQVHLNDTVTMDGDKPVTLSEILEIITGVQVQLEEEMPAGLCSACSTSALHAADFRTLCRQATERWQTSMQLLGNLQSLQSTDSKNAIWVILGHNEMTVTNPCVSEVATDVPKVKHRRNQKIKGYKNFKHGTCQCSECGRKFRYPQQLCEHLKESTDMKRACYICAEIMIRDDMVAHMIDVHQRKPYDCKRCPALLRSSTQYKRHLVNAHSKGFVPCGDCGRSFKSRHGLYAHQSIHTPKTCPGCDKLFRNQTCYVYHVKKCCSLDSSRQDACRTKRKVFFEVDNPNTDRKIKVGMRGSADKECICDYCGKKFAGKKFVCAHIQIVHMKNTHRPCKHCGKMLASAHMTEHVKTHEMIQMFRCEHCGVVLRTKLGYIQHVRLHTGEKPYRCQHCGETFSAASRRSDHIRKVHNFETHLRHACEYCPAKFRLPYRLKRHVLNVHNIKPDEPSVQYECVKCHEKFASCRGLLHHSRKHQEQYANRLVRRDANFKVYSSKVETSPLMLLKPAKCLEK